MHPFIFLLIYTTAFIATSFEMTLSSFEGNFKEIDADSFDIVEETIADSEVECKEENLDFEEILLVNEPQEQEEIFEIEEEFIPANPVNIEGYESLVDWGQSSYTDNVDLDDPTPLPKMAPALQPKERLPQELVIDLKNPTFVHGVITTDEGGVITGQGIRIQARRIEYINKIENGIRIQKIMAQDDLMLEYANRAFVGSRLEYDFIQKTGTLWNGKTFVDIWFLGGDKIELKEDGTFYISNAFVTTCEDQDNTWEISANKVKITEDHLLSAKNIKFQFFKVPLFWLPSFKSNLKAFTDSPIRYKVVWDKGLGPRLTMRYRFLSWRELNLFFRLDYRLKRGFGGALESEYYVPEKGTTFVTRSYGAHDKTFPDEQGPRRYRLQGLFHTQSQNEKTQVHLTWDKLSDSRMVGDFRSDDFEINTQKRTLFTIMHQLDSTFFNLRLQPRLNRFQSIDQELPFFSIGIRPFQIGNSGVLSYHTVNVGYLDYVYANDLRNQFHQLGLKSSTKAFRMETKNTLYRPFSLSHLTLTPSIGVIGIFYSNNPAHHPIGQGIFSYGFQGQTRLYKHYTRFRHMTEPYVEFQGLTSPTAHLSHHFYFDIHDGYDQLNQLRLGWRNSFFSYRQSPFLPFLFIDLFTYGFFGNRGFSQTFPKSYFHMTWNRPFYLVRGGVAWNNEERVWDYANIATEWTIHEDFAFSIEFRHRSRWDWRKANHENFIVNVARSISELLDSPLSDGRNTLLNRLFIRLAPKWTCQIQTRHGWGRKHEPRYHAGKIDFFTLLTCSWKLRLSYERMPNDNRFSGDISLVK